MTKLKLGPLADDKPVKVAVELPAPVHHDLIAYTEVLGRETGQQVEEPVKLIVPMIERFMATDRGFARLGRSGVCLRMDAGKTQEPPESGIVAIELGKLHR